MEHPRNTSLPNLTWKPKEDKYVPPKSNWKPPKDSWVPPMDKPDVVKREDGPMGETARDGILW